MLVFILIVDVAKREEGNSDTCFHMDETEDLVSSKISQSQKDIYTVQFHLYEAPRVKVTETENRMVDARGQGERK